MSYVIPALHTLTASRWTLFCAKLLGRRMVTRDGEWQIESACWRGRYYMLDFKNVGPVDADAPF